MKVVCVKAVPSLTIGKVYSIIIERANNPIGNNYFTLTADDGGDIHGYWEDMIKDYLKPYNPTDKLKALIEDM